MSDLVQEVGTLAFLPELSILACAFLDLSLRVYTQKKMTVKILPQKYKNSFQII
jgi:hypothetical protein